MTKVFISGSRSIHFLPATALDAIDRIIAQNMAILVGDCKGTDTAVQRYLSAKHYSNVTVCHIGAAPRNNLGFNTIQVNGNYQTDKDQFMGAAATYGLAIWDGISEGTRKNIDRVKTKVVRSNSDTSRCTICGGPSENGGVQLPITFHPPSNPRIPLCLNCYKSGRLRTECDRRGIVC